jgi:predicted amidohydrolase
MQISLSELFLAYRQAKQALYQEQRTPDRLDIAEAEMRLPRRLLVLRRNLLKGHWFDGLPLGVLWLPIKSAVHSKARGTGVIVVDGPPTKTLRRLNLRLHLTPSLDFSTVEAIWLWKFGPALEATLTTTARGNRLNLRQHGTEFDLHGRDPFQFWPEAYRRFRDDGLNVAKSMLQDRRGKCVVATFDLASYYDEIDPRFLLTASFINEVARDAAANKVTFDPAEYRRATQSLLAAFRRYRDQRTKLLGVRARNGIPIGALTSRVIANVALSKLDTYVLSRPGVRYYARYVDDILIIASNITSNGRKRTPRAIASDFLPVARDKKDDIILDSKSLHRSGSKFVLQTKKLKVYELTGRRGRDFLATIERDVRLISSERRDLINRDGLESESPLSGLLIGADDRTPVQVLRDVDRLKVERYAANVAIGKIDVVTKFVDAPASAGWCRKQLRPLAEAVTDADHWIEFFDTACRALGVSIRARDIETSQSILERLDAQLQPIRAPRASLSLFWNNQRITGRRAQNAIVRWFDIRLKQEICGSINAETLKSRKTVLAELSKIFGPNLHANTVAAKDIRAGALALQAADLRSLDRESDFRLGRTRRQASRSRSWDRLVHTLDTETTTASRMVRISSFLSACRRLRDPMFKGVTPVDILLMTRPPTTFDIGYRWSRAAKPISTLVKTINAVRGTRYPASSVRRLDKSTISVARPTNAWPSPPRLSIVLGNLTGDESWAWAAATGAPVLSPARLTSLAKVVNRAIRVGRHNVSKQTVLVLPELSVPRAWIRLVAEHLVAENVSLVSGVEYHRHAGRVSNEAVGVFTSGFNMGAVCVWPKGKPARDEERKLLARGVQFKRPPRVPPLAVQTKGGTISTLICSELLEVERRSALMGRIDLLLVPSWNQDTATFDHTIQTTANDVHCYVAIANNATFSDCRIHCPSDERWKRDVCRLICRMEDETISAHLDFEPLREFQRQSAADPRADPKGFKPVPPGFEYKR